MKLLCDAAGYKETLALALKKWVQQYGATRPVEVKLTPARTLHDGLGAWAPRGADSQVLS